MNYYISSYFSNISNKAGGRKFIYQYPGCCAKKLSIRVVFDRENLVGKVICG